MKKRRRTSNRSDTIDDVLKHIATWDEGHKHQVTEEFSEHLVRSYSLIKQIVWSAPLEPFTAVLLHPETSRSTHPHLRTISKLLRSATYKTILARIDAQEARVSGLTLLSESQKQDALKPLWFRRALVYQALLSEPALLKQGRFFTVRGVPTGFHDGEPVYVNPRMLIRVWASPKAHRKSPTCLGEQILSPAAGPEEYSRAVQQLLKAYCDEDVLLGCRFRRTWWNRLRKDPAAWPVVTQDLIPRLYDFLKPCYPTRRYTHDRIGPGPAAYSRQLMNHIAAILREERPELCKTLTWERVQGAVKRHVEQAAPGRPMGEDMFNLGRYKAPSNPQNRKLLSPKSRR